MSIQVRNPRSGQYDYIINPLDKQDLSDVIGELRSNQNEWHVKGIDYRINALKEWHDVVLLHKEELIESLTIDTGRYMESVLEFNLLPTTILRWITWSQEFFAQGTEKMSQVPNILIKQANVPYEVVGVISPWNFPLLLSIIDTIPALLAGCAVIVKPSEITPRFISVIQKTINLCPNLSKVLTYTEGDGLIGSYLVEMTDISCFTGSVETGNKVYAQAASLFKPCFLELGGKDAALVMAGANIKYAAKSILWGSTVNNGHSCLSIERVYVQASIFEEFLAEIKDAANQVSHAIVSSKEGHLGPIISDRQAAIIDDHLQDALARGANIITGSDKCFIADGGIYCRPTILIDVDHSMKIMTQETFGPIIPIMSFDNEADGILLANDSIFGLSGAVFAKSNEEALRIADHLVVGAISINECALTAIVHDGEKNSFKSSGLGGTRMGPASLQRFLRRKAYLINENTQASPWWFK